MGLLCACGVRRFKDLLRVCLSFARFHSSLTCFCPFACPFLSSLLLSSGCPLSLFSCIVFVGSLGVVVVSFSLSDICAKRKGAKCLPCVLSCPVVGLFISP